MGKKVVTEMRDVWDGLIPKIIILAQQEVDNFIYKNFLKGLILKNLLMVHM